MRSPSPSAVIASLFAVSAGVLASSGSCNHPWGELEVVTTSSGSGGSSSSSGGGGGDGGLDGGPSARCGSADLVWWDLHLDAGKPQSRVFTLLGNTSVLTADAAPAIRLSISSPASGVSGLRTRRFYDLRDAGVMVKVSDLGATAAASLGLLYFDGQGLPKDSPLVCIGARQGKLSCGLGPDCDAGPASSVSYSAKDHAYWRISADAEGAITCAVWDGVTLQQGSPALTPIGVIEKGAVPVPSSVRIAALAAPPAGEVVEISDLGASPGATGPREGAAWCKSSTFSDPFDDGVVPGPRWGTVYLSGGVASEAGGALSCSITKLSDSIEYRSAAAYDMTQASISLRLDTVQKGSVAELSLMNANLSGDEGALSLLVYSPDSNTNNGNLTCPGSAAQPLPVPSWVRLRHLPDGLGHLVVEYQGDAGTWASFDDCYMPSLDVTQVDIRLKAAVSHKNGVPEADAGLVVFDEANLAPP